MALITCSDCNNPISDRAAACIHCGAPVQRGGGAAAELSRAIAEPSEVAGKTRSPGGSSQTRKLIGWVTLAAVAIVLIILNGVTEDIEAKTAALRASKPGTLSGNVQSASKSPEGLVISELNGGPVCPTKDLLVELMRTKDNHNQAKFMGMMLAKVCTSPDNHTQITILETENELGLMKFSAYGNSALQDGWTYPQNVCVGKRCPD